MNDFLESFVAFIPHFGVMRLEIGNFKGIGDDFSRFLDVLNFTGGNGLHGDVAECGGFDRAGINRSAAGVRRRQC